jgi:hypothetical protein
MIALRKGLGLLCAMVGASMITSAFMWEGAIDLVERSFPDGQNDLLFIRLVGGLLILTGVACAATIATKFNIAVAIFLAFYGGLGILGGLVQFIDPGFLANGYPDHFGSTMTVPIGIFGAGTVITSAWLWGILGSRDFKEKSE